MATFGWTSCSKEQLPPRQIRNKNPKKGLVIWYSQTGHTRPYVGKVWWDWRILANGYIDELAYEVGLLDRSMPFQELKQKSIINSRALGADQDPEFSKRIRDGLPGMH